MNNIERQLQLCLKKIEKWAFENGFKFSTSKTVGMHFCNKRKMHPDPELSLYGNPIKIVKENKFLGLLFDSKLTFLPHIKMLKARCLKALDILKVVSSTKWGADRSILLNLYRSLVRSKLDYGCIVYGSARKSYIKLLDAVHHQGLRLCLGAFKTSPIDSLYVEADEPSLENRRIKLGLQYATKLKAYPSNPAYNCVFNPLYEPIFEKHPNKIPSFGIRIKPHIEALDIDLDTIAPVEISKSPPWEFPKPKFIYDLRKHKKSDTNPLIIQQHFAEIISFKTDYSTIYTDGSKDGDRVASAAVFGHRTSTLRLPSVSSIFTAETMAIILALQFIAKSSKKKFIICSDSLSNLLAIENAKIKNPLILKILHFIRKLFIEKKEIIFMWVPSHVGIHGNTVVDMEAKDALDNEISNAPVPYSDFKPLIRKYIFKIWQNAWSTLVDNKLHDIQPDIGKISCIFGSRRDQVVLTRCRIGHSRFSHEYYMKGEPPPECIPCDCRYSIKHVLLECVDLADVRKKYFNVSTMFDLFKLIPGVTIINFLKEINLYGKI